MDICNISNNISIHRPHSKVPHFGRQWNDSEIATASHRWSLPGQEDALWIGEVIVTQCGLLEQAQPNIEERMQYFAYSEGNKTPYVEVRRKEVASDLYFM